MNGETAFRFTAAAVPNTGQLQRPAPLDRPILIVYLCYRLGITAMLWTLFFSGSSIGSDYPPIFVFAALAYLFINALLLLVVLRGWSPRQPALLAVVLSDLFILQLIAFASGPIDSGLGTLLVISVAAGAIFLPQRASLIPPAFATLTLFAVVAVRLLDGVANDNEIVASGWLGLSFFVASMAINYLARRMQQSEQRAIVEASSARKLEELNQVIIARMQTGVMIVDRSGEIIASNNAAQRVFAQSHGGKRASLRDIGQSIADYHYKVRDHFSAVGQEQMSNARFSTSLSLNGTEFRLTWINLGGSNADEFLVFAEDLSRIAQQAQQLKLSSLGKLTASIAHEIRNPVGAASHAAQLLRESSISSDDHELLDIIVDQCKRCSKIISNVLEVSRGEPAKETLIELSDWLPRFLDNYRREEKTGISLFVPESSIVRFDPAHLEQLLRNLLDNAVMHSNSASGDAQIAICIWKDDDCANLDVYDSGQGVSSTDRKHLFEPFFTTGKTGSGLGLYICRELCTANQAKITFIDHSAEAPESLPEHVSRHCFRVRFSHPQRQSLDMARVAS